MGDAETAGNDESVGDADCAGDVESIGDAETAGDAESIGDVESAGEGEADDADCDAPPQPARATTSRATTSVRIPGTS